MSTALQIPQPPEPADEELMRELAAGRQEALRTLYGRYGSMVLNMAARTLDRSAAEEIVQDVFLSVWRHAAVFTPERGAFRSWVTQIAHHRIVNELRRRSRRPNLEADPDGLLLASLPDISPELEELAWRELLRSAVRSALQELSPPQQEALDLAFFKDLTHAEVAAELRIPLGTAKSRIRVGLRKLRGRLSSCDDRSRPNQDSHRVVGTREHGTP